MIKNMGTIDRGARIVVAAVLAYLAFGTAALSGVLFWIAIAVAVIFAVTAVVGNCPLYRLIGVNTCGAR